MPERRGMPRPATPVLILILAGLFWAISLPLRAEDAGMDRATLIASIAPHLRTLGSDAAILDAVTRQNHRHLTLTAQEIAALRQRWQAERERGQGPLTRDVENSPASAALRAAADEAEGSAIGPLLGAFLVTDNRDLPVAASAVPANYRAPVQNLWRQLFLAASDDVALFFPADEGGPTVVAAVALRDPDGMVIGGLSVGLDLPAATAEKLRSGPDEKADELQMWRPEELIDGTEGDELISPIDQDPGVAGEGGGVAGDHGDPADR